MQSTMMQTPLLLRLVTERALSLFPGQEVVTQTKDGPVRAGYRDVIHRSYRLAHALTASGVVRTDRVGTLAWNTQRHLELYHGVPAFGGILHTVNFRLSPSQLIQIINHAEDRILFVDEVFTALVDSIRDELTTVKMWVVMGEGHSAVEPPPPGWMDYEEFLSRGNEDQFDPPDLDENDPCGLCYTSGTTGEPKGVLYSHRSNVLHALCSGMRDGCGVSSQSVILPVVPMFHVNAWGLPYSCTFMGSRLILPSKYFSPAELVELMDACGVTMSAGVPLIWAGLLQELDGGMKRPSELTTLLLGGAAAPRHLIQGFRERHGIEVIHAWGMTETSPLGTICHVKPHLPQEGEDHYDIRVKQGLPGVLVQMRVTHDDGRVLPCDGKTPGQLEVRGPWVTDGYWNDPEGAAGNVMSSDGWFRTGDVASIDSEGYMSIVDRTKDLIRSGGEWISSVAIENLLMAHPAVREAAVIPVPDKKWGERPLGCVVLAEGLSVSPDELSTHLQTRLERWQLPDRYEFLDEIPKTTVGKMDKKVLKARFISSPEE